MLKTPKQKNKRGLLSKFLPLILAIFITGIIFSRIPPPTTHRVNPVCVVSHLERLSKADLTQQLALMQKAGIVRTRFDFNMVQIEPRHGHFVWARYDNIVTTAASYGISIIADLEQYNTPGWANGNRGSMYAPHASIYHAYAQAIASHYLGKISLFEMGNEPNLAQFWPPKVNATAYSALLKAGYKGIKAGNPTAKVISAGLAQVQGSNNPISFLTRMYEKGVKGYFDYLGIHPYSQPNGPDFSSQDLGVGSFNKVSEVKDLMDQEGDQNKQIIITEIGWPTPSDFSGGGVTQPNQATYISLVYTKIMYGNYQYVPIACIYDFINDGTDTTQGQDNFGILNANYTQKPAYTSMQMAASAFSASFTEVSP
jgi:polysaccharide biosynthesis protein PslG